MYIACYEGDAKMIDFLIEKGADIRKSRGPKKATILHAVAERDFVDIARKILDIYSDLVFE